MALKKYHISTNDCNLASYTRTQTNGYYIDYNMNVIGEETYNALKAAINSYSGDRTFNFITNNEHFTANLYVTFSDDTVSDYRTPPFTIRSGKTVKTLLIRARSGSADYNNIPVTVSNFMLNSGSTALPYEPYGNTWNDVPYRRYETATDVVTNLPVKVYGDGETDISLLLKGNTETSGTPSPSNPVTINGTGNKTANLFDKDRTEGIIANTYINQSGEQVASQNYYLSYPLEVLENSVYTWSFVTGTDAYHTAPTVAFYDENDQLLSVATHNSNIKHFTFTTPLNTKYIRGSVYRGQSQNTTMFLEGSTEIADNISMTYIPFGYKISILKDSQALTPIYLSQPLRKSLDGTAFDTLDSTGLVTYNVDEYGQPQTATTETVTVPTITTTGGTVTLDVDTTIKPSEMSLTYHGWHEHQPLKRENGSWS